MKKKILIILSVFCLMFSILTISTSAFSHNGYEFTEEQANIFKKFVPTYDTIYFVTDTNECYIYEFNGKHHDYVYVKDVWYWEDYGLTYFTLMSIPNGDNSNWNTVNLWLYTSKGWEKQSEKNSFTPFEAVGIYSSTVTIYDEDGNQWYPTPEPTPIYDGIQLDELGVKVNDTMLTIGGVGIGILAIFALVIILKNKLGLFVRH